MQQNGAIRWLVHDQPILSVRRAIARLITCMISRKWSLGRLCISSKVKQSTNLRNCTKLSKCSKLALSLSCWSRTMDNRHKQRYISMDTRIRDETTQGYAIWNMKAQVFLWSFLLFYGHKTVGRYLSCNFQSVASFFFSSCSLLDNVCNNFYLGPTFWKYTRKFKRNSQGHRLAESRTSNKTYWNFHRFFVVSSMDVKIGRHLEH